MVLPALRFARLWMMTGFALVIAVAVVCLVPNEELPEVGVSDKSGHVLAFGALALWFGSIVVRRALPGIAICLLAFGAAIEVAQGLMGLGRSAELADFIADALGVAAGLLLCFTPLSRWPQWLEARFVGATP